jgi:hypothetical protein
MSVSQRVTQTLSRPERPESDLVRAPLLALKVYTDIYMWFGFPKRKGYSVVGMWNFERCFNMYLENS